MKTRVGAQLSFAVAVALSVGACLGSRPATSEDGGTGGKPGSAGGTAGGTSTSLGGSSGAGYGGNADAGTATGGNAGQMADAGSDLKSDAVGAGGAAGISGIAGAGAGGAGYGGTGAGGMGAGGMGIGGTGVGGKGAGGTGGAGVAGSGAGGSGIGGAGIGGAGIGGAGIGGMMAPPPTPAHLIADNLTINLGMIEAGVTTPTSVRITNSGQAALARTPTATSSAPAELIISSNGCTTALAGGSSCNIGLGFSPAAGESRSQTLTVSDGTTSVTVTVTAIGLRRLTVATTGGGTGTVTSTPAGIQCGTTCSFLAGQDGTMVTLHAQTANGSSSIFAGWSAASCTGIVRDCTVTLLASTTVTATFKPVTANLIFYTSASFAPNRGSAAAYDSVCNTAATAAGINDAAGGAFTAVTSDAATTVTSRLGASANGWVRMDGSPFADAQVALFTATSPKIFNPVRFDELGRPVFGNGFLVMTGTNTDGSASTETCNNWTSSSSALTASAGLSSGGPVYWLSLVSTACSSTSSRILCMGHAHNTIVSPPAVTGRKVWLNNAAVSIVPGQSLDALCQASRPATVTTAAALIARPNIAASSLIDPTMNYVRVDGTLVGTGAQLQGVGDLPSGIWQTSNGQYGFQFVWTGSASVQTAGTSDGTCGNWVDPTVAGPAEVGNSSIPGSWWLSNAFGCNSSFGLYCVQTAP